MADTLSGEAKTYIDTLIRRYAIWFGVTLLGLNIVAGTTTIFAFWRSTYTTAKEEYHDKLTSLQEQFQSKLDTLQKQWDADKTLLTAQLQAEHQSQLKALERNVDAKFNYDYVKQKLTDVTLAAGTLESETRAASEKAQDTAQKADSTAQTAQQISNDALNKSEGALSDSQAAQSQAKSALSTAEETSRELAETLKIIKTNDVELARSIKIMIGLMKDNEERPLAALDAQIVETGKVVKGLARELSAMDRRLSSLQQSSSANRQAIEITYGPFNPKQLKLLEYIYPSGYFKDPELKELVAHFKRAHPKVQQVFAAADGKPK